MNDMVHIEFKLGWREIFSMLLEKLNMKELVNSEEQLYIHNGKVCRKDEETGEYEVLDYRADLFAALRNVVNTMIPNLDFRSDPYITNWGDECPTNGDMIRRMSNQELVDFFHGWAGFSCERCNRDSSTCDESKDCPDGIFEWLISEADTEKEE